MATKQIIYKITPNMEVRYSISTSGEVEIVLEGKSYVMDHKTAQELANVLNDAHDDIQYEIDNKE